MEAKLRQLMKHEGINSTRLAEILGIQASGISHIMSGRNKPSFDFLHKLLQRFPQINPDWLLLDKGPMYRDEIKNKGGQTSISTGAGNRSVGSLASGNMGEPVVHNGGDGSGVERNRPSGGLFGPDNDDIIPSSSNSGGQIGGAHSGNVDDGVHFGHADGSRSGHPYDAHSGQYQAASRAGAAAPYSAHTSMQSGYTSGGQQDGHVSGLQSEQSAAGHAGGHVSGKQAGEAGRLPRQATRYDAQQEDYQSNILKRSAFIERIVVFYKDKTFSEYQPE